MMLAEKGFSGVLNNIEKFARYCADIHIRKSFFISFLCGAVSVLALPPYYFLPALLFSFPVFLWLLDGVKNKKQAFITGWFFGLSHFGFGLSWVANALTVDIARFGWLIPFCIIGSGAALGIYTGLVSLICFFSKKGIHKVIIFAASWIFSEWLRSWTFTGFPWNLAGSVWAFYDEMLQLCSVTGIYGLSLITVIVFSLPYFIGKKTEQSGPFVLFWLILTAFIAVGGHIRLHFAEQNFVPDVKLRIVQANISQKEKWEQKNRMSNMRKHLNLSLEDGLKDITHTIWAETASPFPLNVDSGARHAIAKAAPYKGSIITGTPRFEIEGLKIKKVWNSILAINRKAEITAVYDKVHLVPFGEYVPFGKYLPFEKVTHGKMDFSSGRKRKTLEVKGLPPFTPLICYEIIFPSQIMPAKKYPRPKWFLNVTNDGWYGNSAGPYQHYETARIRAVEEGIPVVRAANTGISAVINAYGQTVSSLDLGEEGILDEKLPKPLKRTTLYGNFGNITILVLVLGFFCYSLQIPIKSDFFHKN